MERKCGNCKHFKILTCAKDKTYTNTENSCTEWYEEIEPKQNKVNEDYEKFKNDIKILTKFEEVTDEMHELYKLKNRNYGDSFSKSFDEYGLTMVCIRLEDKLRRLKSLNKQMIESQNGITDVNVDDESIRDTLLDLANYSVLSIIELDKEECLIL